MVKEITNRFYADQYATQCIGCRSNTDTYCSFKTPVRGFRGVVIGLTLDVHESRGGCKTISRLSDYVAKHPETHTKHGCVTIATLILFGANAPHDVFDEVLHDEEIMEHLYDYEVYMGGTGQITPTAIITTWGEDGQFLGAFLPTNVPKVYPVTDMLVNTALDYLEEMEKLGLK